MPSISLAQPTALTVITAGLHSTNYNALSSLLNGGLDNANIAAAANISPTKLLTPGTTTTFLRGDGTFTSVDQALAIGTTLPGSPVNGQQAILTDSLTAPTYLWAFQYSTGITDAMKWIFIGGSPKLVEIPNQENYSSATYVDLSTVGPQFTIPNTGNYISEFGVTHGAGTNLQGFWMALKKGAGATSDNDGVVSQAYQSSTNPTTASRALAVTNVSATTVLKLQYRGNDASTRFAKDRWLSIVPVRVA